MSEKNQVATNDLNDELDYFKAYGSAASMGSSDIVGKLLRFTKGDYQAGSSGEEFEEITLALDMKTLKAGWQRWENKHPVEKLMGEVFKGFQPARRNELGMQDEEQWEVGPDGKSMDPWAFTNTVIGHDLDDGQAYTFVTSSKGGVGAIGKLCETYAESARERDRNAIPVVRLFSDSYKHTEFGKTYVPVMEIVDWASRSDIEDGDSKKATKAPEKKVKKDEPKALPTRTANKAKDTDKPLPTRNAAKKKK